MGLSEARPKQRLVGAASARNASWLNDTSLPGQRMLAKMGWTPGVGLGTDRQGTSSNLSVAIKLDNKGIGAHRHEREAREQGRADAWVGAGGDLGSLFDRLNAANAEKRPSEDEPPVAKKARKDVGPQAEPQQKHVPRLACVYTYQTQGTLPCRQADGLLRRITDERDFGYRWRLDSPQARARATTHWGPEE